MLRLLKRSQSDAELLRRTHAFHEEFNQTRAGLTGVRWYPHDTLSVWDSLSKLVAMHELKQFAGVGPILDLGCGDGEFAFFLEREFNCDVHAIDYPPTNFNGMEGVRQIGRCLSSRIEIQEMDVDEGLQLNRCYPLTFMLGVLYHLKNPIGVLSKLARHSQHCILSTRVAQQTPDGKTRFRDAPLAYFASADEIGNDNTNFWIFSQASLRRLLHRTGWEILGWHSAGRLDRSDPVHPDRDERFYCVLRSCLSDPWYKITPLAGLYAAEDGWCWSMPAFTFAVDCMRANPSGVSFEFAINELSMQPHNRMTMTVRVNGIEIPGGIYTSAGTHRYRQVFPPGLVKGNRFDLEFLVEPPIHVHSDPRRFGVLLSQVTADYNVCVLYDQDVNRH